MSLDILFGVIQIILIATTPLVFAAIGELVTEKTGVLNLGVEGMMLVGACLLYTSPSPRDATLSRMPSSA